MSTTLTNTRLLRSALVLFLLMVLVLTLAVTMRPAEAQGTTPVFINEFHYDNEGTDTGEFIEVAGPAGTDLTGWRLVLYNGNGGAVYSDETLTGFLGDQQNGFGTLHQTYPSNGIQNGSPDGIALVDDTGTVIQFLSYEGTFTAVGGPADGMTSVDVGVS
ncbi:MAG: lamin tail domain-containing protein, partial [Anaerolineales bacterium]|nr:lamin tail domain-containing protein [Anaerolineales bacterium]